MIEISIMDSQKKCCLLLIYLYTAEVVASSSLCVCESVKESSSSSACQRRFTSLAGSVTYETLSSTSSDQLTSADFQSLSSSEVCNFRFLDDNTTVSSHRRFRYKLEFVRDDSRPDEATINTTRRIEDKLLDGLRSDSFVRRIFGGEKASLKSYQIDVDECESSLNDCKGETVCSNTQSGYECSTAYCLMSLAPETPKQGNRTVVFPQGKKPPTGTEPERVPVGTSIEYTCDEYYDVKREGNDAIGYAPLTCKLGTGWSGSDTSSSSSPPQAYCVISLDFKIALIASVVSGVIILTVGGALCLCCCRSKSSARKERDEYDEELDLVYRSWEESQQRQRMMT